MIIRIYSLCLIALQIFTIIKVVNSVPIDADEENIVYGEYAVKNQFKYQVSFIVNGAFQCGGSIINENVVLTAAHCVPPKKIIAQVIAGVADLLDDEKQVRYVTKVQFHPEFLEKVPLDREKEEFIYKYLQDGFIPADLALLFVDRPFQFNDAVSSIPLSTKFPDIRDQCLISGWGMDENLDSEFRHLKWATVDIIPRQISDKVIISTRSNSLSGGFACFGDSGGPMTCNNELAGVASSVSYPPGVREGDCKDVILQNYASVPKYFDWIIENSRGSPIPYPWNGVTEILRK